MKELIKEKLKETRKCKFKSSVLNSMLGKDWTCVHIDTFTSELTNKIKKKFYVVRRKPDGK